MFTLHQAQVAQQNLFPFNLGRNTMAGDGLHADEITLAEVLKDAGAKEVLGAFASALGALDGELTPEAFKATAKAVGKETGRKGKELFFPLRAAITGRTHGPDLSRTASIKGRQRVAHLVADAVG